VFRSASYRGNCFCLGFYCGLRLCRGEKFFDFTGFEAYINKDTDPNIFMRLLKNIGRNIKVTGGYFLFGVFLSALFQRYVPSDCFAGLFGRQNGFGVLMAATAGVPLYAFGAVKMVLGVRHFMLYLAFTILFSFTTGLWIEIW
jgi:uncharacterized membrane protein YraQ (UPF0718 family)